MAVADDLEPLIQGVLNCVCDVLNSGAPYTPVCRCVWRHSAGLPPMEGCECVCEGGNGEAWIRVVGTQLQIDSVLASGVPCSVTPVTTVQVGVYRCISVTSDDGRVPPVDDVISDAQMLLYDMQALIQGVTCCPAITDSSSVITVGAYTPISAQANCAGGALTFTVAAGAC